MCDSTSVVLDHLRRPRTNQTGRSLVDITGDSEVFVHLHKYFVFLLKAGGQRVIECVLEGPPRVMAVTQPSNPHVQDDGEVQGKEAWLEKPLNVVDFQVVQGEQLLEIRVWSNSDDHTVGGGGGGIILLCTLSGCAR